MHAFQSVHRKALSLVAIAGAIAVPLATPAIGHADESNPNNYDCFSVIGAGQPEAGSEEQQVRYRFYCNGPITGYQLQAQVPITGIQSPPSVSSFEGQPSTDTFACSGEVPGYALNCVGATKAGYEVITGQFAIGSKLCAEPRVDPLLTVTYASSEKNVVTQSISGPFDVGRPKGCPADALSGSTRLNPHAPLVKHRKSASKSRSKKAKRK